MVDNVEKEFRDVEDGEGWQIFFLRIRNERSNVSFDITEAKKAQNKKLNRYQDVNPFDHSRIILKNGPCDYINASLVPVKKANRSYILAQGPLPNTTPHFWLMIWEQNSRAIIMLNRIIEKNMVKCHQYWPQPGEDSYVFNEVGLKVSNVSEEKASYYTVTKLKLEHLESHSCREVIHFHYTAWPDFGCPQSPNHFLKFLTLVRNSGTLDCITEPPVVHCSAGIGRSGTFCLVDSCLRMIKELGLDNVVVRDVLLDMRRYRMGLVQTSDQLRFSYLALIEGLKDCPAVNGNVVDDGIEEEEEPPPLPPPREESLRYRQNISDNSRLDPVDATNEQRKRERDEKQEKLDNKVREVKAKLRASENWQHWRRTYLNPLGIGVALVSGGLMVYWLTRG